GRIRLASGDARGAKEANEQALALRRKALPSNHPDLGRSSNNLGLAEQSLGNNRDALADFEEAARIWRTSLGPTDPLLATALTTVGSVRASTSDFVRAKKSLQESLAIRQRILLANDPDLAQTLAILAVAEQGLGNSRVAVELLEGALRIWRPLMAP